MKNKHIITVAIMAIATAFAQNGSASSTSTPVPQASSSPIPANLSPQQLSAIITISGSGGSGTGFICLFNGRPVLFTNQHVIAGNPNASFRTQSGKTLLINAVVGAVDADLAMFELQNIPEDISPLEFLANPEQVALKDDDTCIPGNSKGDGVITQTFGKVIAVGPQRVETDNPVYPGNSGSPIIHIKSGKVIGVLTEAELISLNEFEKASFRNKKSAIKSEIRYFGYRLDTVSAWQKIRWDSFQKLDSDISQSKKELHWIADYFTDASDSYKEFKELHTARNRVASIIDQSNLNVNSKIDELKRFLRDIDYLLRRTQTRLANAHPVFIHKKQIEDVNLMAKELGGGVDIAERDTDLTRVLVQRGN